MKFGMMLQFDLLKSIDSQNLEFCRNPRWWTVTILKTVKLPYFSNGSINFHDTWHADAYIVMYADVTVECYW